jgi:hypothetical protein
MVGIINPPSDLVLNIGTGDCSSLKIFRKRVIVDWCQSGNNPDLTQNGSGVWVHIQVIVVSDNEAPILLNAPAGMTISADENCQGAVGIPQIEVADLDDCSPNIIISVTSPDLNLGANPYGPISANLGNYSATYLLDDGCGNTVIHNIDITVVDDKKPTPVCIEVSAQLMPTGNGTGMLMLPATALVSNTSSFDNCSSFDDLIFTAVFDSLNNPNLPPTTTEIFFTERRLSRNTHF